MSQAQPQPIRFDFPAATTEFMRTETTLALARLAGLATIDGWRAHSQGLFVLETSVGRFEGPSLVVTDVTSTDTQLIVTCRAGDSGLTLKSTWTFCPTTHVVRRRDELVNTSAATITIYRCLPRFVFVCDNYDIYSQASHWCNENQGRWTAHDHGTLTLRGGYVRTTEGGTPFAAVRHRDSHAGVAFHILPVGNWVIHLSSRPMGGDVLNTLVVEAGLSDQSLRLPIAPNETIALPEILIQPIADGSIESIAPNLHRYLLANDLRDARLDTPVVFNTWFDCFDILKLDHLETQLAAVKEIGCDAFVIDAGWYGGGKGDWAAQTGDWREKTDAAFFGRMKDFADKVRAAGLIFGIWMEPERLCPIVPIRCEHPEWFISADGTMAYPDLANPKVYAYTLSEISRLVDTYNLGWMKIDFNFDLGYDTTGSEHRLYMSAWYKLLAELRTKYPKMIFEACASGGLRNDLSMMKHTHGHFLSDTVSPIDALRIGEGAMLRLLPGRIGKWVALRSGGYGIPKYGVAQPVETIVTPNGATWDFKSSMTTTIDFVMVASMSGMMGLTGDPSSLGSDARERIKQYIAFYKQWREFIAGSVAYLQNEPKLMTNHNSWSTVQLSHPTRRETLVFAARLVDGMGHRIIKLRNLEADTSYVVTDELGQTLSTHTGCELMNTGLRVEVGAMYDARVRVLTPQE